MLSILACGKLNSRKSHFSAMSVGVKCIINKIHVDGDGQCDGRDRDLVSELCDRHNVQSVLETCSDFKKDNSILPTYEKYLMVTNAVITSAPDSWILDFVAGFNDELTGPLCVNSLKSLVSLADAQSFSGREIYVFEKDDYENLSKRSHNVLTVLLSLLRKVSLVRGKNNVESARCALHVAFFCVLLISRHCEENHWTEKKTVVLAQTCIKCIQEYFELGSVNDILVLDLKQSASSKYEQNGAAAKTSLLSKLLTQWKVFLQRTTWRQNPVIAWSFSWCLSNLKFPNTSNYLELLLPPALLFVDDHVLENKEMGTRCLINVMENAGAEELRWFSRAEVIYEALKLQVYSTEESMLKLTHQALLLVLNILVRDAELSTTPTKYDEIFLLIVQNASHENKIALRRAQTESLHIFIERLGINVVKYLGKVLDLVEEYLEVPDGPNEQARLNILKALKSLLQVAWPRIPDRLYRLLKHLIKFLHEVTSEPQTLSQEVEDKLFIAAVECLQLLKTLDSDKVSATMTALKDLPFSKGCRTIIGSFAL